MTAELRNCEARILHNNGWPPTALLQSTCCKLSGPATHHLLIHDVRSIDLAEFKMNFDRRHALSQSTKPLCFQKLYYRPHFTVGVSWNKSLHLQPLQRCYCENSGSPASACVMRCRHSITDTKLLHAIGGLLTVGQVRNLICRCLS